MATSIPTWQSPRLDYTVQDGVTAKDFVRIEGNILNLRNTGRPFATTTGTSTQYAANIRDIPQLEAGLGIRLKIHQTNSGVATLNLNGLGVRQIVTNDQQPTLANDMRAGQILDFSYNGESWQIVGATQFVPVQTADEVYLKTLHVATALSLSVSSGIYYYKVEVPELHLSANNTKLLVKFNASAAGKIELSLNGMPYVPVKTQQALSTTLVDPAPGDISAYETYILIYRGDCWEVHNSLLHRVVQDNAKRITDLINVVRHAAIPLSAWSAYNGEYRAQISENSITASSIVDVNIEYSYKDAARNMLGITESGAGYVYVFASEKPTSTVYCDLKIVRDV